MSESMRVREVVDALERLAPPVLAEPWDRVGLQVGALDAPSGRVMLCIDLTPAVVREAVSSGVGMIIAYHPPMFAPLTSLTTGPRVGWKQQMLVDVVRRGLSVYSPHTALDATRGGVNDWLCEGLGRGRSRPIAPTPAKRNEFKVIVYVPAEDEATLRDAMANAGAGGIGNYRECSFSTDGTGGFRPVDGANPAIGSVGQREEVAERRLEMLTPGHRLAEVLAAIREVHRYEEPAIDVFALSPEPETPDAQVGAGRLLELEQAMDGETLADALKARLGVNNLKVGGISTRPDERWIRRVAVCVGSGGKLFESVEADAYITGEMQHHQALDLVERGKAVLLAGHTQTERPYLPVLTERLKELLPDLDCLVNQADQPPLQVIH